MRASQQFPTKDSRPIVSRSFWGPLTIGSLLIGVLLVLVLDGRSASLLEQPAKGLEVRDLQVPPITLSGMPATVRAVIRNAGSTPLRAISSTIAVSTDLAPGMQVSIESEPRVRSVPALAPGAEFTVTTSVALHGDGWVRLGVLVWSADDIPRPVARQILVIDPLLSSVELLTLLAMLSAIAAMSAALVVWLYRHSDARAPSLRDRQILGGMVLVASAAIIWVIASASLRSVEPERLRLLTYVGVLAFAVGWVLTVSAWSGRSSPFRLFVAASLYQTCGCLWITLFYTWLGWRPTSIAASDSIGTEAVLWPLHISQALLGLYFR